jgi:hypothetical protein
MLKLSYFSRFANIDRDYKFSQQALGAALAKIGFRKLSNVASTGGAATRIMSGKVWIGRVAEPRRESE